MIVILTKEGKKVPVKEIRGGFYFTGEPAGYQVHAAIDDEDGAMISIAQGEIDRVFDSETGALIDPEQWGDPEFPGHPNYDGPPGDPDADATLFLTTEIESLREGIVKIRTALLAGDIAAAQRFVNEMLDTEEKAA